MAASLPSVTVVIPAFRQATFVRGCLDSVAAQSYGGQIEVVVVDDGCPERSGDVAAAHPISPKVIRQPNSGVAAARNRGIAESTGRYVAFLDADDRWHPSKLKIQIERLEAQGAPAFSFTRYRAIHPSGQVADDQQHPSASLQPSLQSLARQNFVGCSTAVVHRLCLEEVGGFPDSTALRRGGQDYALWLRIASIAPLVFIPEVLVDYMVHPGSRVGNDAVKNFDGAVYALRSFQAWSEERFVSLTGRSYRALVGLRALDMARDLKRRSTLDVRTWRRAARSCWLALASAR
ncbi:MAG: glycosyltransferase family 2 protein [Polyangiaceae bacterium]|nr:glycosyltransferase family 2 protein [Polyangiaceae bacterium]MCW5790297.1 glycosyltransferase family 2 protein [Polyangiaceae bacterium]